MALELIDLVTSILVLILGFSLFTMVINDYRTVSTVSRIIKKKIKVAPFKEVTIPIYPSVLKIEIISAKSLNEGVNVEVQGNTIRIYSDIVISDKEVKILIDALVIGRVGDYPVRGVLDLSPY